MLASFPIPHHALGRSSQERSYSAHQRVDGLPPPPPPPAAARGGGRAAGGREEGIDQREMGPDVPPPSRRPLLANEVVEALGVAHERPAVEPSGTGRSRPPEEPPHDPA